MHGANLYSHCPWVNNCVANNNHRHFIFYVLFLELGVLLWVRLGLACTRSTTPFSAPKLTTPDLELLPTPTEAEAECTLLAYDLCSIFNKDPFTIVLSIWASFQLTWVSMLLVVQLIQVARNLTTYESMRGHLNSHTPAEALNTFVTTGDTSQDVAPGATGETANGFGSGQDTGEGAKRKQPKRSIWDQWKRLLGLDTFVTIALNGSQAPEARNRGNPFSRGVFTNCKDFFCDGAPVFKGKESGYARLGGERVDYTRLYEVPKMRYQRGGGQYESVSAEEADV
jgi:hypothetical protein